MPRVSTSRLASEELKGLFRSGFALWGSAALLLSLLVVAAVGMGTGSDGFFIFALYALVLIPLLYSCFAAANLAGLRATGFSQLLFTRPVSAGQVLAAKTLVAVIVAVAYLAVLAPFIGVYIFLAPMPPAGWPLILLGVGTLTGSIAIGTLVGVVFTSQSLAAPVTTAAGIAILQIALFLANVLLLGQGGAAAAISHLSPLMLLWDGVGLALPPSHFGSAAPTFAVALFLFETLGLFLLATWIFTREQSPDGWEARAPRRWVLVAVAALILTVPIVSASTTYGQPAAPFSARHSFGEQGSGLVALVAAGASPGVNDFFGRYGCSAEFDPAAQQMAWGAPNRVDLFVEIPSLDNGPPRNFSINVHGEYGLDVRVLDNASLAAPDATGRIALPQGADQRTLDGNPVSSAVLVRVPLMLTPRGVESLARNQYGLVSNFSYELPGAAQPITHESRCLVQADMKMAPLQLALAGAPATVLAVGLAVSRKIRTSR